MFSGPERYTSSGSKCEVSKVVLDESPFKIVSVARAVLVSVDGSLVVRYSYMISACARTSGHRMKTSWIKWPNGIENKGKDPLRSESMYKSINLPHCPDAYPLIRSPKG